MHQQAAILAPVSAGELLDKISILRIKVERITDANKAALAQAELDQLAAISDRHVAMSAEVAALCDQLKGVNEALWDIEDDIRGKEHAQAFDAEFIALARSVYITNDRRAALKRSLNAALGSQIVEVKEYV